MNDEKQTLTLTQTVQAAPAAVYYAFTNGPALEEWLCTNAQVDAREGGRLYLHWNEGYYAAGEFNTLQPNEAVAFTWQGRGEPAASRVEVTLTAVNGDTQLSLTHGNLGSSEAWAQTRQEVEAGWRTGLANLKSVLETGLDRRVYDRPMLGVLLNDVLNAEQAAEAGLPVSGGVRISGTVSGTGAEAAGLQAGDILVRLGGTDVTDFASLGAVITAHKAGDNVELSFYRNGEPYTQMMQLSRRPTPNVPATAAAFADALRQQYETLQGELDAILDEITEAEASWSPAPGEWSVKDVLAHLMGSERINQLSLALQLSDQPAADYPNNSDAWMGAMTTVYNSLGELRTALKQTEAETVALVAALPAELVARKATYLTIGNNLLFGQLLHSRAHFTQIRDLVAAFREREGVTG